MKKEMLINVLQPEECRIAIVEDGILEELYVERTSHESYVGNIYKGRIVNIEPSIQAAFVDFGVGRNGFLHVSDVEPAYYRHLEQRRDSGRGGRGNGFRGGRRQVEDDEYPARRQAPPARRAVAPPVEEEVPAAEVVEEPTVAPAPITETTDYLPGELECSPHAPREDRRHAERDDDTAEHDNHTPPQRVLPESEAALTFSVKEVAPSAVKEPQPEMEFADANEGIASSETEVAPEGDTEASPEMEAPAEAEPTKSRRRSRSSRARRPRTSESAENVPESPETEPTAPPEAESTLEAPAPHEKPKLMDSAERRTEAEEVEPHAPLLPPGEDLPAASETPGDEEHFETPTIADSEEMESAEDEVPVATDELAEEEDLVDDDLPDEPISFDEEEEEAPRRRSGRDDRRGGGGRRPGGSGNRRGPGGRPGMGRPKPLIQDIFRRGQEVLVQVIKEGIGTKGPTLSTYISIAGRYLVLMPGLNRIGVSRKIADDEQRRRLREILNELQPPKGLGFIIRTAGLDRNKKELQRDLAYLSRLWQVVVRRIRKIKAPAEIYQESDMITRTIRDTFTGEIDTIWVDEAAAYEHAQEFLTIVMPRYASRIKLYDNTEPMFHKYGIEDEISRIQRRHVPLPHGGSIVIDQTEALVAIDVNSGNFRADNNAEETAYQMNLHAAKEIARQLRLRDLGGVIVNDFIDMREEKHRRGVERAMREAVKRDRARTKILKISQFGIIEMTRQRIRPSLKRSVYQDCPHCNGTGQVKTVESMSIDVMRMLQLAAHRPHIQRIHVRVHEEVANYLSNRKRKEITHLEEAGDIQVTVHGTQSVSPEFLEFTCYDNNNEVKLMPYEETKPRRR